jgi:hypothetical protein
MISCTRASEGGCGKKAREDFANSKQRGAYRPVGRQSEMLQTRNLRMARFAHAYVRGLR